KASIEWNEASVSKMGVASGRNERSQEWSGHVIAVCANRAASSGAMFAADANVDSHALINTGAYLLRSYNTKFSIFGASLLSICWRQLLYYRRSFFPRFN